MAIKAHKNYTLQPKIITKFRTGKSVYTYGEVNTSAVIPSNFLGIVTIMPTFKIAFVLSFLKTLHNKHILE